MQNHIEKRGNTVSNQIESQDSELIVELSEQELEAVAGGRLHGHHSALPTGLNDFFFQQTNIQSFASNEAHVSDAGASSKQETGYTFSQTTIAIGSLGNVLGSLIGV